MPLAIRLYNIRRAYGLTQADVAYKMEISPQAYSQMEREAETIRYHTLLRIANALQVPVSFLVAIEQTVFLYTP